MEDLITYLKLQISITKESYEEGNISNEEYHGYLNAYEEVLEHIIYLSEGTCSFRYKNKSLEVELNIESDCDLCGTAPYKRLISKEHGLCKSCEEYLKLKI